MKLSDADIIEQLAIAEARWSFYAFRQYLNPKLKLGWWQRESAYELQRFYEELVAGGRPKLIIEAPPQHGKSLLIIDFVAWLSGHHPDFRTIYTSFSERLGVRANLRLQRMFATDKYKKVFPDTKLGGTVNRDLLEFEGKEGYFRNTTVRGSITGEGLDLGIIDDPIKGREQASSVTVRDATWDWLTDDFMTRFADDAGLLIILTRWHIDDPVGRLKIADPSIRVISHPAIATEDEKYRKAGEPLFPEHKSLEFLQGIKKIMAASSWESLYQQRPFIADGEFFKPDMIQIVDAVPIGTRMVRAWDLAATEGGGDWTVGFKFGKMPDGRGIIVDIARFQRGPDKVRLAMKNTADMDGREVAIRGPQDPGQAGKDQAQQLTLLLVGYKVKFLPVSGDKTIRADGFASQVNVGNIVMLRAPWNQALIDELRPFPNGANDDQVDAGSDAFNELMGSPDTLGMWANLGK